MAPPDDFGNRLIRRGMEGTVPVLIVIVALAAGVFALLATPREEEPQIIVPMADVMITAPTLSARQVERLVATPLEKLLVQIDGVEHVYSISEDGSAVVTVRFFVGEDREDSLVKLYNKIFSGRDIVPEAVTDWVVKPVEVDDVPIIVASLWSDVDGVGDFELRRLAEEVALSLQRIANTNRTEVIGGRPRQFRVEVDPIAMAARNTAIDDVLFALEQSNVRVPAGGRQEANRELLIETSARVRDIVELGSLTVNVVDGVPVRLVEVAAVTDGPAERTDYTWITFGPAHSETVSGPVSSRYPAVSISVAKKKGANAVQVARDVESYLASVAENLFPAGTHVEILRNYGETANRKIGDLIGSLGVALVTVIALISVFLGWRAALVVALAVPVCYGLTLVLDYASGYTINRVTLFALILALGLLVDDPITGVDNMRRHLGRSGDKTGDVLAAMNEIRTPLVMSTIAIMVAFAPMSFITGMMGPYMSPLAFNVPVAVIMSTLVAFLVTPWLGRLVLKPEPQAAERQETPWVGRYRTALEFLFARRSRAWGFLGGVVALLVVAMLLPLLRVVPLKLLPYDNKNEFQVVIDAPVGATLEAVDRAASEIADYLTTVPEVRAVAAFSGVAAPMDFNGMVRHYYLRGREYQADLQVTLADKLNRSLASHGLVLRLRPDIERIAADNGVLAKVVEVPPGPPVISTVVAEHYGDLDVDYATLIAAAEATADRLRQEVGVVDVDTSAIEEAPRLSFVPDREKAALSGISAAAIAEALQIVVAGRTVGYADVADEAQPLAIHLGVPYAQRSDLGNLRVKGLPGIAKVREPLGVVDAPTPLVSLAELGKFEARQRDQPIYHKNLTQVAYTFAEVAGRVPAAVIYDVDADLDGVESDVTDGRALAGRTYFTSGGGYGWQLPEGVRVVWSGEGEWDITLQVFIDLGIAFGVALVGIFFVIRLQTGLSMLTIIVMLSIPLTAIGIMPGFWLLNVVAEGRIGDYADPVLFTATAMIGMIALAGIVVRNSLILVEFVQQALARGEVLSEALVLSGAIRARPILLTAGTTLLGNLVITLDPIFSGLAWSIIFGVIASTAFTLFVVPVVYHLAYGEPADA